MELKCGIYIVIHVSVSLRELKIFKVPLLLDKCLVNGVYDVIRRGRLADHGDDGHEQHNADQPQYQQPVHQSFILLELEADDVPFEHVPVCYLAVDFLAPLLFLQTQEFVLGQLLVLQRNGSFEYSSGIRIIL